MTYCWKAASKAKSDELVKETILKTIRAILITSLAGRQWDGKYFLQKNNMSILRAFFASGLE